MKRSLFYVPILCLGMALTNIQCGKEGGDNGGGGAGTQSGTGGSGTQVGVAPIIVPQVVIGGSSTMTIGSTGSYTATPQNIAQPFQSIIWRLDGAQILQPQSLTAQVTASTAGSHVLSVTITGADGQSASATANLTASAAAVSNTLPSITSVNVPTGNQPSIDVPITFIASDPDGDALTYKIRLQSNITTTLISGQHTPFSAASSGTSIGQGGFITHRVNFASAGTYGPFVFIVEDGKGGSVQSTPFSVTVTSNQMIQNVSITGPLSVLTGQYNWYTLNYFDQEGDSPQNIQWSATDLGNVGAASLNTTKSIAWNTTGFKSIFVRFSDLQGRSYGPYSLSNINVQKSCASNPSHTVYAALTPTTSTGSWNGNYLYTVTISAGGKSTSMSTSTTDRVLSLFLSGTDIGRGTTVTVTVSGGIGQLALDTFRTFIDFNGSSYGRPQFGSTNWTPFISAPLCQ